jgi:hypothetical protein
MLVFQTYILSRFRFECKVVWPQKGCSPLLSSSHRFPSHSMTGNLQRHKQQRAGADPLAMEHMAGGIGGETLLLATCRAVCLDV